MFTTAFFIALLVALLVLAVVFIIIDYTKAPDPINWILKLLTALVALKVLYDKFS